MLKTLNHFVRDNKIYTLVVLILTVVGGFLRFYRIPEYLTFLSDQGRDAIVLKKIITLEKFTFIGPTTSIGNVFTGPFYYYLVAPFLKLTGFDPSGPAYGIALLNTLALVICTLLVAKTHGKKTSIIFLAFCTTSANLIWQSRFSWNPNPVPYFSFLTLYLLYFASTKNSYKLYIATGLMLGFTLQLHYIALILGLAFAIEVYSSRKLFVQTIKNYVYVGCALIATFTPLILFDIKNKFINLKTLVAAQTTGEVQAANTLYIERLPRVFSALFKHIFFYPIPTYAAILIALVVLTLCIYMAAKSYRTTGKILVWCIAITIAFLLAFSRLETQPHAHYYNAIILPVFLLIAISITKLTEIGPRPPRYFMVLLAFTGFIAYSHSQILDLHYLRDAKRQITQVSHAKQVADYISSEVKRYDYQVVGLPFYETENHYRYFLEFKRIKPMPSDTLGQPKELFVICHYDSVKACEIAGNPQWQVADFQNKYPDWKIVSTKKIQEVLIVKIISPSFW